MDIHLPEEIVMDTLSRKHLKNNQNSQKFLSCRRFLDPEDGVVSYYCSSLSSIQLIDDPEDGVVSNYCSSLSSIQLIDDPEDGVVSYCCSSLSSIQLIESVQKLDYPSDFKPWHVKIYYCFDGLSIMGVSNYNERDIIFFLWNPFTRESVLLPNPKSPPKRNFVCGMGYDSTTNDYKVLKIGLDGNYDCNVSIELLSLKKGSWSKIDEYSSGIFYLFNGRSCLAFVHGAFHWLGFSKKNFMISFNISNEVYGEIPLSEQMDLRAILEGMLCVFSNDIYRWGHFILWQMKDYGVEASWINLITVQCSGYISTISKKGEVLLCCIDGESWIVFMTSNGQVGLWPQRCMTMGGFISTENLISPKLLV
ncbi:hypothetical protein H5410_007555 [Solanum commersonii]|uniref:F-box associated beta-propeller type 3 domain-containing protein n=1 Tax=Solanum commersonii TaxID=4109 RepID=A0A9J6AD07_SOLCO|nr:hypothetical protein H5410_007555 [Solanum commersonii]